MADPSESRDNLAWAEKYRPVTFSEMVGHLKVIDEMRSWAESWSGGSIPKKKGLILEGEPGVGKTTAAYALANEMGWEYVELNASDSRNLETIRRVATRGAQSRSITDTEAFETGSSPRKKLIILDEADNLYERGASDGETDVSDKGGKKAIAELMGNTMQPVILIVNDYYALIKGSGNSLASSCIKIKFRRLGPASVAKKLRQILKIEGISYDDRIITALSERSGGDMRSAIGDLQTVCAGKMRITTGDMGVLGSRDTRESIFKILEQLFRSDSIQRSRKALMDADETPDSLLLWVSENLSTVMTHPQDLDAGYSLLSRADIYLGRVRRRQNYRLWTYANDMMSSVYLARKHRSGQREPYRFPSYLKTMSQTKDSRALMKEASGLIGRSTHSSIRSVKEDTFYRFGTLAERDPEFAAYLMAHCGLKKEHLSLMTGGRLKAAAMKKIQIQAEEIRSKISSPVFLGSVSGSGTLSGYSDQVEEPEVKDKEKEEKKEETEEEKGSKQMSLFEF
ncbi:MAG: replication factor C large subunit [Thermoplasmatota archaeon]